MKFRTELTPEPARAIDPRRPIMMLGSCFSDNIGRRLQRAMAEVTSNPCGTLFNPASIASVARKALRGESAEKCKGEMFFSWDLSTHFSRVDEKDFDAVSGEAFHRLREGLLSAEVLIVTFGTAIVYELASSPGRIVANCHKQPAATFMRRMLSVDEIVADWEEFIDELRALNRDVRLIFTVSPVRHIKEGFRQNTLSKARLHLACEELCQITDAEYFPAYELVNDDLRDYRFCDADMQHPSAEAVEYVWEKFKLSYFSDAGRELLRMGEKITARLEHRHINPGSPEAAAFDAETARLLASFRSK